MTKSFAQQVLDAVQGMGPVSAEAIADRFPNKTRREITKAFQNLTKQGRMRQVSAKQRSESGVFTRAQWEAVIPEAQPVKLPCVSCVWNLCSESVQIPWMPGRTYQPLGAWA